MSGGMDLEALTATVLATNKLSRITAERLNSLEVQHTTNTQNAIEKDQKEVAFIDKKTRL